MWITFGDYYMGDSLFGQTRCLHLWWEFVRSASPMHTLQWRPSANHWDKSFHCFFQKEAVKSLIDNPYCLPSLCTTRRVRDMRRSSKEQGVENNRILDMNTTATALVFMKHWTGKSWDTSSRQAKQHISSTIVAKTPPGCRNMVCT